MKLKKKETNANGQNLNPRMKRKSMGTKPKTNKKTKG